MRRTLLTFILLASLFSNGCWLLREKKDEPGKPRPGENPAYYESVRRMSAELEHQQKMRRNWDYSPVNSARRRAAREQRDFEYNQRLHETNQQREEDTRFLEAAARAARNQ